MNGLNYDPGLRNAITQQHRERLLRESNQIRLLKNIPDEAPEPNRTPGISLSERIKPILGRVRDTGKAILIALGARNESLNA
jgi:hypothetical protein